VVGVILILFVLIPLLIREREGERILPWARGERSAHSLSIEPGSAYVVLRELLLGIVNKKRFLAILIIFTNGLALGYFDAMMPVFTVQELHWESKEYSEIASIAGLCAGALGILLSGVIMNRLGSGKTINIFILCMILIPVLLLSARTFWYTHELIFAFIILILIVRTLALIAIFALCMSLCSKLISATHFALFTAFGNLGISSGSGLFGHFSESYTYVGLLVIYAGISIITLFTSLIYHKEKVRPELIIEPS
jgi:PAT family beta-lactamase induction signal transducer AmpG